MQEKLENVIFPEVNFSNRPYNGACIQYSFWFFQLCLPVENNNKCYPKFKIWHVQIDELPRSKKSIPTNCAQAMFSVVWSLNEAGKPFSLRLDMNFDMSLSSQVIFEHIFSTLTTTQDIHGRLKNGQTILKFVTFNLAPFSV